MANVSGIRLQKIIADSGYCSRRKAEAYIEAGLVKVNGRTAKIGDKANPKKDIITVEGKTIKGRTNLRYIKLYKPRGYVCSMSDPHADEKKLITNLLRNLGIKERVYPVGRLDANSEGLILLTNDGSFANKVAHPSNEFKKTYRVTVAKKVTEEQLAILSEGVDIGEDGAVEMTRPCIVDVATSEDKRTVLIMSISEGKNRQIRRMCTAVGLSVTRLKRISIGGVKLGMLAQGEYSDLTNQELRLLGLEKKNR
ncbi:MAG: rRNA pseudouridine synthase [Oscillospiraceae bacterium]|nr:rRNA pseudouridine synthase [Oscillospiraceae bacterium]